MPSRADAVRRWIELAVRLLILAALAGYLGLILARRNLGSAESGATGGLEPSLARWSTVTAPARIHLTLTAPPTGRDRDWLVALEGSGSRVTWSGEGLLPTAVLLEPRADPAGGADVSVAAPSGARVVLHDTLGAIDSAIGSGSSVRSLVPRPRATIDATVGPVTARGAIHDSLGLGRLAVIGSAGWETKFVVAALEERGWQVDLHAIVAPRNDVRQGQFTALDTARYAAVLALDTTAARYADRITHFVESGGGLLLWPLATRIPALARLAPGLAGALIEDDGHAVPDSAPRAGLSLMPIEQLRPEAIALERQGGRITLAGRRIGLGRVLQSGYLNSWRWRMAGGETAPALHRAWLAGLVAGVAYTRRTTIPSPPTSAAPLATLIGGLGPPTVTGDATPIDLERLAPWIFGLIAAGLLLEWLSRRLRGAK